MTTHNPLFVLAISVLVSLPLMATDIDYPEVSDNPSYASVTALEYQLSTNKISYGENPNQYGLLWSDEMTQKNSHLVVLIHGGCWLSAYDIKHTYPLATALHQEGFNVYSLEYRRTGETGGGWPQTYDDIKAGLSLIKKFPARQIPVEKVTLVGHSAGGHLALLAGRDHRSLFPEEVEVNVIGLAAITDIKDYASGDNGCQKAGALFLGIEEAEQSFSYHDANPAEHEITIPVTLMHGAADPIVPLSQTTKLDSASVTRVVIEKAGHFDWVHPGSHAFARLLEELRK